MACMLGSIPSRITKGLAGSSPVYLEKTEDILVRFETGSQLGCQGAICGYGGIGRPASLRCW